MSRMRDGGSSRLLIMSRRDPTTKQTGHFRLTPQGGVLFGPPLRRGSSEYHPCQVRHRRRFLMVAKNHAVATRRVLGQAPSGMLYFSDEDTGVMATETKAVGHRIGNLSLTCDIRNIIKIA